jgi:4a-hydroxytetrahydrobiopterin dehydratase
MVKKDDTILFSLCSNSSNVKQTKNKDMQKLNEKEIQEKMTIIDEAWKVKGKFLHREFLFKDFVEAFSFMTAVALVAEKSAHHPNWKNTYNKLTIDLSTHDADGITTKDFNLAKVIDTLFKKYT